MDALDALLVLLSEGIPEAVLHDERTCGAVSAAINHGGRLGMLAATLASRYPSLAERVSPKARQSAGVAAHKVAAKAALRLVATEHVAKILRDAGVECAVLKGMSHAYRLYRDPLARPGNDVDILTHPDCAENALSVLLTHGYRLVLLHAGGHRVTPLPLREVSYWAKAHKLHMFPLCQPPDRDCQRAALVHLHEGWRSHSIYAWDLDYADAEEVWRDTLDDAYAKGQPEVEVHFRLTYPTEAYQVDIPAVMGRVTSSASREHWCWLELDPVDDIVLSSINAVRDATDYGGIVQTACLSVVALADMAQALTHLAEWRVALRDVLDRAEEMRALVPLRAISSWLWEVWSHPVAQEVLLATQGAPDLSRALLVGSRALEWGVSAKDRILRPDLARATAITVAADATEKPKVALSTRSTFQPTAPGHSAQTVAVDWAPEERDGLSDLGATQASCCCFGSVWTQRMLWFDVFVLTDYALPGRAITEFFLYDQTAVRFYFGSSTHVRMCTALLRNQQRQEGLYWQKLTGAVMSGGMVDESRVVQEEVDGGLWLLVGVPFSWLRIDAAPGVHIRFDLEVYCPNGAFGLSRRVAVWNGRERAQRGDYDPTALGDLQLLNTVASKRSRSAP